MLLGLGSSIGSPIGRILSIVDRVSLGAFRKSFRVAVSICGAMVDNIARPMVEATASDTTHTRASRAILVAFKPPYHSKHYAELVFLFSAT